MALFAESETEFFLRLVDTQVSFTKSDSGAVTGIILHQNGANQSARKVDSLPALRPGMETMQNSAIDSGLQMRAVVLAAACWLIASSSAADGQVPSAAPDTVPAELLHHYDDNNRRPRDIAVVVFSDTATQAQKDSALAVLDGEVVGGIPVDRLGYDGAYIVRMSVPDTARLTASTRARSLIRRAPGVKVVLAYGPNTARAARAQAPSMPGPAGARIDVETRGRWIRGDMDPRTTGFSQEHFWIDVDSVRTLAAGLDGSWRWYLTPSTLGRPPIEVTQASGGSASDVLDRPPVLGRLRTSRRLPTPSQHVPFIFGPVGRLEAGDRWTDTLDIEAAWLGTKVALSGERTLTVTGYEEGRRGEELMRLEERTTLNLEEGWTAQDYSINDTVRMVRRGRGSLEGSVLVDPRVGLTVERNVVVRLAGEETVALTDGRVLFAPSRYEGISRWRQNEAMVHIVLEQEARDGIFDRRDAPTDPLSRRLADGSIPALDSLFRRWTDVSDPAEYDRILGQLGGFARRRGLPREDLLERGDTLGWLRGEMSGVTGVSNVGGGGLSWSRSPLTLGELTFLLPMLDDAELAWARGVGPSDWWEYLMRMVQYAPPAVTPDTADWRMTPDAYHELSTWRQRASEPRLRDFATLAWFALDPGPRFAELASRVGAAGSTDIAEQALRFANGGVPPRGAPTDAWRRWAANGQVDTGHERALSLYALIHPDRDVRAEIVRRATEAEDPEERALFHTIGGGLGLTLYPSPDELVSAIASGDSTAAARAQATLGPAFDTAEPASDSLGHAVIDDLLGQLFDDGPGWRRIREPDGVPRRRGASGEGIAFVDSVPTAVPPSWAARIQVLSREEWSRRRQAEDGTWVLGVRPVRRLGPIVEVWYSVSQPDVYVARTVYLVRVDDRWRVLSESTFLAH